MKIETFILRDNDFVPIEHFNEIVPDQEYIEGAIQIEINNKKILSTEDWDCVDQLWSYLFDGILSVKSGKSFSTYFPDSPIEIVFDNIGNSKIEFTVKKDIVYSIIIEKELFIKEMVVALTHFLKYLPIISPDSEKWCTYMSKRISDFKNGKTS